MPSKPRDSGARLSRWALGAVVFAVGALTLWLGVPRVVASLQKAPAHFTLLAAHWNQSLSSSDLAGAAAQLEKVRAWEDSADLNSELGFLLLLLAAQSETVERRNEIAAKAAGALQRSLLLGAAQPQPWVRLAFARYYLGEDPARITAPIEQSRKVGPYVGDIAVTRLKILLINWDDLSPELKNFTYDQIRYIWPNASGQILEIAQLTRHPEVIRHALRQVPDAVERLDRVIPAS